MFPAPVRRRGPYLALVASCLVVWLLPLLGVAFTALRTGEELARGAYWALPERLTLENFAAVLASPRMGRFIANSFLVTVPAVAATLLVSAMAGFALAKHALPGARLLLMVFVAGNLVPFQALMIGVRDLMLALGLHDTRYALILFHTAFQAGFCTLFLRNFIRELPDALLETARLEGASELRVFWLVVLPLVRPALAALAVLVFTFIWNDYFWSLVLVQSDEVRPLTAGLQTLRGMWQTSWELVTAGALLAALPPVALFFLMQRELVAGLTYRPRR